MKDRHASDYRVGEVHDDIDGAAVRDVDGVQPQRVGDWLIVFCVRQEMNLMDMYGMKFCTRIDDFPVLISAYFCAHHGRGVWREFFSVDVKALFVFCEDHHESRWRFLFLGGPAYMGSNPCFERTGPAADDFKKVVKAFAASAARPLAGRTPVRRS